MRLNALLMCRNQGPLQVLAAQLGELGISQDVCLSAPEAVEALTQGRYSALILDFDLPGAAQVAQLAHMVPPRRRPVVFAMIGVLTGIGSTFQAGANFVLYKPLVAEQVARSLRVGRGFMRPDRRRATRHKIETLAYLKCGTTTLPTIVVDISEGGLALQAPEPLTMLPEIGFRFALPGGAHSVEGSGELIWADDIGRAGMLFTRLTAASQKYLKNWLAKRSAKRKGDVRPPAFAEKPHELAPAFH